MSLVYILLTCGLAQIGFLFFFSFVRKQMMFNRFEQMGVPKRPLDPIERVMLMTKVAPYLMSLHRVLFITNIVCNVIVAVIAMAIFL